MVLGLGRKRGSKGGGLFVNSFKHSLKEAHKRTAYAIANMGGVLPYDKINELMVTEFEHFVVFPREDLVRIFKKYTQKTPKVDLRETQKLFTDFLMTANKYVPAFFKAEFQLVAKHLKAQRKAQDPDELDETKRDYDQELEDLAALQRKAMAHIIKKCGDLCIHPDSFGANIYTKLDVVPEPNGTVSMMEFAHGFNPVVKKLLKKALQLMFLFPHESELLRQIQADRREQHMEERRANKQREAEMNAHSDSE